jgi:hypothetical protein
MRLRSLLYDPARDRVVLLEQFRVGALEFPGGPWLLEIVAGIMDDPDETTEEVARRETVEEAGCEILELIPICHYLVSPGGTSESITLFCGRVDTSNRRLRRARRRLRTRRHPLAYRLPRRGAGVAARRPHQFRRADHRPAMAGIEPAEAAGTMGTPLGLNPQPAQVGIGRERAQISRNSSSNSFMRSVGSGS